MEILQPQQKMQIYGIYFVFQLPKKHPISKLLPDSANAELLSIIAAALTALATATA